MAEVEPLEEIEAFGKGGEENRPVSILGKRGEYFYVRAKHLERLEEVNGAYRSASGEEIEPLDEITVIGRGGTQGHRPFLLSRYPNRYLCIPADQLKRLREINQAYRESLEEEERRKKKREEAEEKVEEVSGAVREAEEAGAPEQAAEAFEKAKGLLQEMENALAAEDFGGVMETGAEVLAVAEEAKEAAAEAEKLGKYVYCIIPNPGESVSFGDIGIEDSGEVYTLPYKDLAAVVSDAPLKEYRVEEEAAENHNQIITQVMEDHPVVPMAYGMVFKNEKILKNMLNGVYGDAKKTLDEVGRKVELGLKILTSEDVEIDEDKFASDVRVLPEIASAAKKNRKFSDRLLVNASYLVPKEKVDEFSEAVDDLDQKYSQLELQYSGPWPPFSFVDIEVGRED